MSDIKYEHPLEYYTVDNFIKESREMIGKPIQSVTGIPTYDSAKYEFTTNYAYALGIDNPLYDDLIHAVTKSRYNTIVAPPTFLTTFRYPICRGALFDGPYPLVGLEAAFEWQWNDVIRMNDRFTTEHILTDVYEKSSDKGRTVYLVSECKYWNQLEELVATCCGTYAAIARAESITEISDAVKHGFAKQPITDREIYYTSDEEIERISKEIFSVTPRGTKPLYWDDVDVGDKLPPVSKGPLTTGALMGWHGTNFSAQTFPTFGNAFRQRLKKPGFLRTNSLTRWPYDLQMTEHNDPNMSGARGMPYMFGMGSLKAGLCTHLLSNWMGDDGFLRKLNVGVLEPYIYGDTLKISGDVVKKYEENLGGAVYSAVDVKIATMNQLGQNIAPGTATVYLPTIYDPVNLPIPQ